MLESGVRWNCLPAFTVLLSTLETNWAETSVEPTSDRQCAALCRKEMVDTAETHQD